MGNMECGMTKRRCLRHDCLSGVVVAVCDECLGCSLCALIAFNKKAALQRALTVRLCDMKNFLFGIIGFGHSFVKAETPFCITFCNCK